MPQKAAKPLGGSSKEVKPGAGGEPESGDRVGGERFSPTVTKDSRTGTQDND